MHEACQGRIAELEKDLEAEKRRTAELSSVIENLEAENRAHRGIKARQMLEPDYPGLAA